MTRGLRGQSSRLRRDWGDEQLNRLATEVANVLANQAATKQLLRSVNVGLDLIERTLASTVTISSATPTDLIDPPITLKLERDSYLVIVQTVDWSSAGAGVWSSYVRIDQTDYTDTVAKASVTGTVYITASRVHLVPVRKGTHAIRWRAKMDSGVSSAGIQATLSRLAILIFALGRFDNATTADAVSKL